MLTHSELCIHLDKLHEAVRGTEAEASFDAIVDTLLRASVGATSARLVTGTVATWQGFRRHPSPSRSDDTPCDP